MLQLWLMRPWPQPATPTSPSTTRPPWDPRVLPSALPRSEFSSSYCGADPGTTVYFDVDPDQTLNFNLVFSKKKKFNFLFCTAFGQRSLVKNNLLSLLLQVIQTWMKCVPDLTNKNKTKNYNKNYRKIRIRHTYFI
jgi:hypothetical protein